jgi:GNAT superfamily N-acetyltransferase
MKTVTESYGTDLSRMLVIKELTRKDANDLISAGFPFGEGELDTSLSHRFLQAIRFIPHATRLVAYHIEEKRAIGILCLVENTAKIYSIRVVFTDPKFRKIGVASEMFKFALLLAKKKGAKKVYLDVGDAHKDVISLYQKLGFQILGSRLAGQGFLTKFPRLHVFTRTLRGEGYFEKFVYKKKGQLIPLTGSNANKKVLFGICQRCMTKKLINFFELDPDNIMNGYAQSCQPFFLRDALINDLGNSYALIFNRPFFSNAMVELGSVSDAAVPPMLEELFKILSKRGMAYAHMTIFNASDPAFSRLFKEKGFQVFNFCIMGINL